MLILYVAPRNTENPHISTTGVRERKTDIAAGWTE